jgi:hypothetical protein
VSSSPARPKALKAAFIAVEAAAQALTTDATVFVFQYNPQKLVRTFSYVNPDGTIAPDTKAPPTQSSPVELIYLTLELDAADQLEHPEKNPIFAKNGLHPALATLEFMVSPPAVENTKMVLFFWGTKRLLATRLVSLKVSEEAFDLGLNPIRVNIDLCLRVMPLSELKTGTVCYNACRNQLNLEAKLAFLYKQSVGTTGVLNQVTTATTATAGTGTVTGAATASGVGVASGIGVGAATATKKKLVAAKTKTKS